MPVSKRAPRVVALTDDERKALDLRIAGHTFDSIGVALNTDRGTAYKIVGRALKKSDEALAAKGAQHRELEAQRLDVMLRAQWSKVAEGDEKATQTALKIMERRAKMLALDMPQKVDVTSAGQPVATADAFSALAKALAGEADGAPSDGATPAAGKPSD